MQMSSSAPSFLVPSITADGRSLHQEMQSKLQDRPKGGPHEQVRSIVNRHRHTRGCEIQHSSMEDCLSSYKTLEPTSHHKRYTMRKYHLDDGYKCFDQDTIVVSARDSLFKTRNGHLRSSTGVVTYSDTQRKKLELDVQELTRILANEGHPQGGHFWTPKKLERVFKYRSGRPGVWGHYDVPFGDFLKMFPRTFDIFNHGENVRLQGTRKAVVVDIGEDAVVRLARARTHGHVEGHVEVDGCNHGKGGLTFKEPPKILPDLHKHRMKAVFKFRGGEHHDMTHTNGFTREEKPEGW